MWCLTVNLSLSHWYPGSGVVLDCIDLDLCILTYFVQSICNSYKEIYDIPCRYKVSKGAKKH